MTFISNATETARMEILVVRIIAHAPFSSPTGAAATDEADDGSLVEESATLFTLFEGAGVGVGAAGAATRSGRLGLPYRDVEIRRRRGAGIDSMISENR